jgi:hypothetical protein
MHLVGFIIRIGASSFDQVGTIVLSGKVSFCMSAQHSQKNVLPQLVERKQYKNFHHPLPEVPKTFVTYATGRSLRR